MLCHDGFLARMLARPSTLTTAGASRTHIGTPAAICSRTDSEQHLTRADAALEYIFMRKELAADDFMKGILQA